MKDPNWLLTILLTLLIIGPFLVLLIANMINRIPVDDEDTEDVSGGCLCGRRHEYYPPHIESLTYGTYSLRYCHGCGSGYSAAG